VQVGARTCKDHGVLTARSHRVGSRLGAGVVVEPDPA
jgi:hypothetical protein